MDLFELVYDATLGLTALSLIGMLAIITRRAFLTWRTRRDTAQKNRLTDQVLQYLESPQQSGDLRAELKRSNRRLFIQLFEDLIQNVTGEYARRLVQLMRDVGLVDEYMAALKAYAWWRRAEACMDLAWFNEPRVVAALEAALDDSRYEVRVEAARSLTRLGAVSSVSNLIAKLAMDEAHPLTVIDIFRNLGPGAVPELVAIIESETAESAKRLATEALGYSGDLRAVEALLELCQHPSAALRLRVVQALGLLEDPRSSATIWKALSDSSWEVRAEAAICIGRLGLHEAIPDLEKRLDDEQWWVRYEAAEALFTLGDPGLFSLRAACASPVPHVAEIARAVIQEKGLTHE